MRPCRAVPVASSPARPADGWTLGRRLERAGADLQRRQEGWVPAEQDLADAPVLVDWQPVIAHGGLALAGIVSGHPGIAQGHRVLTSLLVAVDIGAEHWARTVSRFYQLGPNGRHPSH
jgi:hypothetical protein